ncbi:hypothetical protein FB45DRAFT_866294 [Roridomyces roridus]|uniref:Mediator complex subunit 16 C-terminal domain-containing protein n=1 Tax=Roridomyces roridus TaxID=1738132 RepID=A0AAD7BWS9_9AGAR|nr:hypothetical protein FB45DRAFT_866294 [Roridomyces roridus]
MIPATKGKAKEETHGWWEYHALIDQSQRYLFYPLIGILLIRVFTRPVAWSATSTIFSAHSTQPLVTARHFSSSKQFVLASPKQIIDASDAYEPPTVISVSPAGDWVFAYFPGSEGDGVGCMWRRGAVLDTWTVKHSWPLARGGGVVTASWLGAAREWTVDEAGSPSRLPPRGPSAPVSEATLVLVTEDCWVTVCYLRYYTPAIGFMRCPLGEPGSAPELYPKADEKVHRTGGSRKCLRAAIGLAYDGMIVLASVSTPLHSIASETAILVATRSRGLPSRTRDDEMNSMNLSMPLNLEAELDSPIEWENWGEESTIELCEIRLRFDGEFMGITSTPLPPVHGPDSGLSTLAFVSPPPPPKSDPADTPQKIIYLAASYLDFGDYTSTPKSQLFLHSLSRVSEPVPSPGEEPRLWTCSQVGTRVFTDGVLAFMTNPSGQSPSTFGLLVGVLETSRGPLPRRKSRTNEIAIGVTKVLQLPGLSDHNAWEPAPIMSPGDLKNTMRIDGIACALLAGTATADLSHVLGLPTRNLDEVLIFAENIQANGTITWRALGLFLETYRMRARNIASATEREVLEARWQTALDICSLASCNAAFDECRENGGFELDAVWQLVGISTWIVDFTEKLLRECILSFDLTGSQSDGDDDIFDAQLPSMMLVLAHPYALGNLCTALNNVTRFKNKIGSLSASTENAQLAKSVLVDLIECSGVDFNALEPLLADLLRDASNFGVEETRRGLATCEPTSAMGGHIRSVIAKIASSSVVDKPRLFIKPFELMDGAPQILDGRKDRVRNVVSKGFLSGRAKEIQCLRCGGKSEVGGSTDSVRWGAWEKMWVNHCICGGAWVSGPVQ